MTKVSDLRLSVASPVVTMLPKVHAAWEETGTIEDLAQIAEAADRLGYHHLTCSEHIGVPPDQAKRRGATYWDPLPTFGYLAARTSHIKFATNVLVLGYHHPLEIAKRYGTLDVISGGRVILGVGVGTLKDEFDLLGAPFDDRGQRADEALRALRASLAQPQPTYQGSYYHFDGLVVRPHAVQPHLPIWIGGRTLRSLRRAVTLADGWCPFGISSAQAHEWLQRVELPPSFDVVLGPDHPFDPTEHAEATLSGLTSLAHAGATIASVRFEHRSLAHYLEQLEAMTTVLAPS